MKSLALASRPQVLENWPVLGSRTALFFELLKFCGALEKFFGKRFFVEIFFFFGEHLRLCPWSLALASSIPVLGLESVCPRKGCPWPWPRIFFVSLALASSLVPSTPPLVIKEKSIVLLRLVKDELIRAGGVRKFPCTIELINSVKYSRAKYFADMEQ